MPCPVPALDLDDCAAGENFTELEGAIDAPCQFNEGQDIINFYSMDTVRSMRLLALSWPDNFVPSGQLRV